MNISIVLALLPLVLLSFGCRTMPIVKGNITKVEDLDRFLLIRMELRAKSAVEVDLQPPVIFRNREGICGWPVRRSPNLVAVSPGIRPKAIVLDCPSRTVCSKYQFLKAIMRAGDVLRLTMRVPKLLIQGITGRAKVWVSLRYLRLNVQPRRSAIVRVDGEFVPIGKDIEITATRDRNVGCIGLSFVGERQLDVSSAVILNE